MILKYRTSPLTSPPHSSFSYIDNISHITPSYNPSTSTLTLHLTLRNISPYPVSTIPTTLVLNDLTILLTDDGKFLDKLFDPASKSHYPTYSNEDASNTQTYRKPYKQYRPYKPYSNKPYYKNRNYNSNYNSDTQEEQDDNTIEQE